MKVNQFPKQLVDFIYLTITQNNCLISVDTIALLFFPQTKEIVFWVYLVLYSILFSFSSILYVNNDNINTYFFLIKLSKYVRFKSMIYVLHKLFIFCFFTSDNHINTWFNSSISTFCLKRKTDVFVSKIVADYLRIWYDEVSDKQLSYYSFSTLYCLK